MHKICPPMPLFFSSNALYLEALMPGLAPGDQVFPAVDEEGDRGPSGRRPGRDLPGAGRW